MKHTWGSLRWLTIGAAALALSACGGVIPSGGLSVQDIEFNPSTSKVEFVGPVEAIASDAWTVGGVPVGVTADTQIDSGLAIGDLAKVHALVAPDTSLSAQEIRAVESDVASSPDDSSSSEVEFTGAVISIDPAFWVVGDQTVAVDAATEIQDAIVVDDMVKVHALVQADGSLLGTEIALAEQDPQTGNDEDEMLPGELDFFGAVEDMQTDHWVVGGTTFLITPDTEIKDAIILDDFVKVEATQAADGSYTAHEIELEDSPSQPSGTEFFGEVTAMGDGSWTVGGLTFLITPTTEIKDAIIVGDFVKVEASVGIDGTLTALEIELDDDAQIGDDSEDGDDDSGDDDQEDEQETEDDDSDHSGSSGSGGSGDDD